MVVVLVLLLYLLLVVLEVVFNPTSLPLGEVIKSMSGGELTEGERGDRKKKSEREEKVQCGAKVRDASSHLGLIWLTAKTEVRHRWWWCCWWRWW